MPVESAFIAWYTNAASTPFGSLFSATIPLTLQGDLKNAVREVAGQASQLEHLHAALDRVIVPLSIVHGDADDFAPIETAERFYDRLRTHRSARASFRRVAGADHFLNDGPPEDLIALLEDCLPRATPLERFRSAALRQWLQFCSTIPINATRLITRPG